MAGTIRTFDERVRQRVIRRLEEILHGTVEALGCKAELEITSLTPAVVNDPQSVLRIQSLAHQLFPDYTIQSDFQVVVSEDMAHFLNQVPGCFVFIGSADAEKGLDAHHHHPKFDFDEKALPVASALAAAAALSCLTEPGS
jgi:amidohydrolase